MWKIYYETSAFSSEDGDPEAAPTIGVLVIAQPDPDVGRILTCKFDWYYAIGDEWFGSDWFGMIDGFMHRGARALKAGRTVSNRVFRQVYQQARHDPFLPVKSGWRHDERKP